MEQPLLATKLFLPPARADRVRRERLLARLDALDNPSTSLGLISAPAGFGKTSLLAEWISERGKTAAWLSLDAGDNDPQSFLIYLCAALERAIPGLGRETAAAIRGRAFPQAEDALPLLANELALKTDPARPLIIALDDAQHITSAGARACLSFLVERMPPGARLAIASRADPALPLARLRAGGRMVELRAAHLRFTAEEAAEFLRQSIDSAAHLSDETAAALAERTEGWAAGLQMAAVALQAAPGTDPIQFARTFSGSHRFVLDYLAEEVLSRLPDATARFLLHTAPLERFCAGLCQTVLGDDAITETDAQEVLESLERANLFLVPLDAERRWYRYHHLFADLLRARLKQVEPDGPARTHRRAAAWFEGQGLFGEAIQHGTAAGECALDGETGYELAARLVEQHTLALFIRGELNGMQRWMSLLPESLTASRPWLCVQKAWMLVFAGQLGEIAPLLQKAEAQRDRLSAESRRALEGHCAAVRCYLLVFSPAKQAIFATFEEVKSRLPDGDWGRGVASWAVGYVLREQGQAQQAAEIFDHLLQDRTRAGDPWGVAMAATDLGLALRAQGRISEALQIFRSGLGFVEARGARAMGYTGRLLTAMTAALYDRNELDAAQACLDEALALNERWQNPNHTLYATIHQARILAARGDTQGADLAAAKAESMLRGLPVVTWLAQAAQALRVTTALAKGQIPAGIVDEPGGRLGTSQTGDGAFSESEENQRLLAARTRLAQGRWESALTGLEGLEPTERQLGRGLFMIDILTMKALALHHMGDNRAALDALEEAARRAAPEKALRLMLDAAPLQTGALRQLFEALRRSMIQRDEGTGITTFIEALLAALPGQSEPASTAEVAAIELVEPLSGREMEVLRLMAQGFTNAQIAEQLVISKGTVKAHTASIYRKLDAENRTQAVAKSRQAGIL